MLVGLGLVTVLMLWFGIVRSGLERVLSLVVWGVFVAYSLGVRV